MQDTDTEQTDIVAYIPLLHKDSQREPWTRARQNCPAQAPQDAPLFERVNGSWG